MVCWSPKNWRQQVKLGATRVMETDAVVGWGNRAWATASHAKNAPATLLATAVISDRILEEPGDCKQLWVNRDTELS